MPIFVRYSRNDDAWEEFPLETFLTNIKKTYGGNLEKWVDYLRNVAPTRPNTAKRFRFVVFERKPAEEEILVDVMYAKNAPTDNR